MMDRSGDHFEATVEDICLLLFPLLGSKEDYSATLYCAAVGVNHLPVHWGELGLHEAGFEQKVPLLSATKRGRRVLTGSSPGGKDPTWMMNSRCCGFVCVNLCILTALKKKMFLGGCIVGSPEPLLSRCTLKLAVLSAGA